MVLERLFAAANEIRRQKAEQLGDPALTAINSRDLGTKIQYAMQEVLSATRPPNAPEWQRELDQTHAMVIGMLLEQRVKKTV
jgi:hypothetical protein